MDKVLFNIQLVVLVLILFLVIYTIYYIRELKNCVCFKSNDKYKVNLEFLEFYQYLELFSVFIIFMGLFSFNKSLTELFGIKPMKKGKTKDFIFVLLSFLVLAVYFLIKYNVMVNVYKLSNTIKEDCDCANKWERFLLYYQGIVSGVEVVHYSIGFFVLLIVLITGVFNRLVKLFK